jgi:putative transposase
MTANLPAISLSKSPIHSTKPYTPEIRRLIYTTNPIEAYHRGLRKATKTRSLFPTDQALLKVLWLAHDNIAAKWSKPPPHWELILNQLPIRFADRLPL